MKTAVNLRTLRSIVPILILIATVGQAQSVDYSGYTEYDGRPANLQLNFGGPAAAPTVNGKLSVDRVCEQGVHLTGVDLTLTGTATGPWENPGTTINGAWTGGDTDPCTGMTITNDPNYPNTGGFTISIVTTPDGKNAIRLVRMPTGYGYAFDAKGFVYSAPESPAVGSNATYADSGAADLKILELSVPTGIKPGSIAKIDVTFANNGSGAAGPFEIYGYAFAKDNYQYSIESDAIPINGLATEETQTTTLIMIIPSDAPSGSWDVKVAIDNSNYAGSGSVTETNENNNEKWKRDVFEPEAKSSKDSSPGEDVSETKTAAEPIMIFERNTLGAVENNPLNPTKFTLNQTYLITEIRTYHWNYGQGQTPGAIGILDEEGKLLFEMAATGQPGMGGVPDAYWMIQPNLELIAGEYTIQDSDPSTWSQNFETGGQGIAWIFGLAVAESTQSIGTGEMSETSMQKAEASPVLNSDVQGTYGDILTDASPGGWEGVTPGEAI